MAVLHSRERRRSFDSLVGGRQITASRNTLVPESVLPPSHRYSSALERQLAAQRARRPANPLLSLVVPVFNEEESIDIFLKSVEPFLEGAGLRFEIVFVNDGSRDNTLAHLLDRSARD